MILRLVAGHMPYGVYRFSNQRVSYFTFLREPIDRVVSAYYYVKRTTEHPMHHRVAAGMSLLQYIQVAEDNRQTRQLGRYDFAEILTLQKYWWARIPLRGINREHLAVAKETLRSCDFVGLYENFAEDVCELFERLGLPRPLDIPRVLESVGRPRVAELEPHIVEEIRKEHIFDCELYEMPAARKTCAEARFWRIAAGLSHLCTSRSNQLKSWLCHSQSNTISIFAGAKKYNIFSRS